MCTQVNCIYETVASLVVQESKILTSIVDRSDNWKPQLSIFAHNTEISNNKTQSYQIDFITLKGGNSLFSTLVVEILFIFDTESTWVGQWFKLCKCLHIMNPSQVESIFQTFCEKATSDSIHIGLVFRFSPLITLRVDKYQYYGEEYFKYKYYLLITKSTCNQKCFCLFNLNLLSCHRSQNHYHLRLWCVVNHIWWKSKKCE